jgi:hypothetical protein
MKRCLAVLIAVASLAAVPAARADYQPTKASLDTHPLPAWWRDAKFGIPVAAGSVLTLLGGDGTPLPWHRDGSTLVVELPSADMGQATRSEGAATIKVAR